jgi:hypothetical protein
MTCIEYEKENIPFGIVPWCSLLVIQKLWSHSMFQTILHVCVSLPGQEKRYMHINVHTHTHIYIMMKKSRGWGWGDEREHIHISGDSSPICKRHLVSMLKGIKSYLCLVQTFGSGRRWDPIFTSLYLPCKP